MNNRYDNPNYSGRERERQRGRHFRDDEYASGAQGATQRNFQPSADGFEDSRESYGEQAPPSRYQSSSDRDHYESSHTERGFNSRRFSGDNTPDESQPISGFRRNEYAGPSYPQIASRPWESDRPVATGSEYGPGRHDQAGFQRSRYPDRYARENYRDYGYGPPRVRSYSGRVTGSPAGAGYDRPFNEGVNPYGPSGGFSYSRDWSDADARFSEDSAERSGRHTKEWNDEHHERPGFFKRLFGSGPKGYKRSDERVRDDIAERLMQSPEVDSSDVSVEVSDGVVTLEGTVPERYMKHVIEDFADSCMGVKDVDNKVRVKRDGAGRVGASTAISSSNLSSPSNGSQIATTNATTGSSASAPKGRRD